MSKTTKIRIKDGTPTEVKTLYKAIKQKRRAFGEPYTQAQFIDDIYLDNRNTFHKWTSDPQQAKPSRQSIVLMNQLAEREGV